MMSESSRFFSELIKESLLNLHTSMPCKVLQFNATKRTAKLQPLFKYKAKGKEPVIRPPIEGVPVLYQKFKVNGGEAQIYEPAIEKGDVVLVTFSERAIDDVLQGDIAYAGRSRHHSLTDAVVVGVIG